MPNMSYCRFENTLNDLKDCLAAIKEEGMDTLDSLSEVVAAEELMLTAKRFIKEYERAREEAASFEDESVS